MNDMTSVAVAAPVTLQDVLDRLAAEHGLSDSRRRDLRSAVTSYAKIKALPPAAIPVDFAEIRRTLDGAGLAQARVSRKRWANLRADLGAAIKTSGLRPMLKTADVRLDGEWAALLAGAGVKVRYGLSRFARWAILRGIRPPQVDSITIERFVAELEAATLAHNLPNLPRAVAKIWNTLVDLKPDAGLKRLVVPPTRRVLNHVRWPLLLPSLRQEIDAYIAWAAMRDPLAEGARKRGLAPRSLRLQRMQILAAVTAAVAAGIPLEQITSLANLIEPDCFRALLRHRWQQDGRKLTSYTHNMAMTLIAIAATWVKAPTEQVATLKALRSKLGMPALGLTEKNKALLRQFDDPRLLGALLALPEKMWHAARRGLATSRRRAFIDLQTALAIDLLLHIPLRLENLSSLKFDVHLHWPQGRHRPALLTIGSDEVKNVTDLAFEIPTALADRFWTHRHEIVPAVTGARPQAVFVTLQGRPRKPDTIAMTITKALLRHLGVTMTLHQFRHLAAKIVLDNNPGAFELVRQLLGHKNMKTTTNSYAGIDTKRAGRAHAALVMKLRESKLGALRRRRPRRPKEDDPDAEN